MILMLFRKYGAYLWKKKDMKAPSSFIIPILALALLSGCDPLENGPSRSETENNTIDENDTGNSQGRHLYVSGVSFPEGYDWKRDTAFGKVPCNIFLMRDGEMICKVPAGENGGAEAASDRHHIIGGHLYTEHSEPSQTVIQRDGKEILRYNGSETLRGMLIEKGKLLTLGQNRYGHGFALRRSGKVLFSSEDGEILGSYSDRAYARTGALYDDNGTACFSYFSVRDGKRSWHFVNGGEEAALEYSGISTVYDMKTMMGDHYAVAKLSDGSAPVLLGRGLPANLSGSLTASATNDYRLCLSDDRVLIVGEYRDSGLNPATTGFWDEDGLITKITGDCRTFRYKLGQLDYLKTNSGKVVSVSFNGKVSTIPGEWCVMTPQCLCWTDESPVLALSSQNGKQCPAIWKGGTLTEIDINGFLTGVTTGD